MTQFKSRYCEPATSAEATAAGYDVNEILPEESFYRLTTSPSHVFRIPGFRESYTFQSSWEVNQIMHPWWM